MTDTPAREEWAATAIAPGPDGYPIIGILPEVDRNVLDFFVRMWHAYGDVVHLDLGAAAPDLYIVVHPDDVKHVLQDNHRNYGKGYQKVKPLLGDGLVAAEGDYWLRQRRLMQPMFNRTTIPQYVPAMIRATEELLAEWHGRPDPQTPIDVAGEMMKVTMRVITRTMFSGELRGRYDELNSAFTETLAFLDASMLRPELLDRLPTPSRRRFLKALAVLDEIIYGVITRRRASDERPDDLLSLLLEAKDDETGQGMTDRQIRDEVVTIFFAGHETTATALAWTWVLLSRNPHVSEQMVQEIDAVLAGRTPALEDVEALPYTRMVFDEALRLYPPAWMFGRVALGDDVLGGYHIAKGAVLLFSPYLTHRHPDFWENPEGFDPERFSPEASKKRHRYAYFPFGGGPRLCLGMNFSLIEGPLMLAMIAQQFRLHLAPAHKIEVRPMAVLRPQPDVMMTVSPRA
jgi:cytochrome P450